MATNGKASLLVQRLQNESDEIFHMVHLLEDLPMSEEERLNLQAINDPKEKMEMFLNEKLQKGESACQELLDCLENKAPQLFQDKRNPFDELLRQLKLEEYKGSKLTLKQALCIGVESLSRDELESSGYEAWNFLKKLIALDGTARNTRLDQHELQGASGGFYSDDIEHSFDFDSENNHFFSIHPLDVICALLHCSDSFLQQEIVSKMSMSQFAVPLLLPSGDGQKCTFMLWAVREIVKKWRPQSLVSTKGFKENSLVDISMPIFSFMRLGKCNISKSKILNQVLSPAHAQHDFFVHSNLECGYSPQKISDGLVEITWYFPRGREMSDIFPEPIAITNLRGDLSSNWANFSFLSQISSAVIIFVESLDEKQYNLLSGAGNTNYYFVICPADGKCHSGKTLEWLKKLCSLLKISSRNLLVKDSRANEAELVKQMQTLIRNLMKGYSKGIKLEDVKDTAYELGIYVDESSEVCQDARKHALKITMEIKDVVQYKKENMKLQGDLWRKLTENEKEICRMKKQSDDNGEKYRSQLFNQNLELRRQQSQHNIPDGIKTFLTAITQCQQEEKMYFLKWLKYYLDSVTRHNLSLLQAEYKEKCNLSTSTTELKQLDQRISDSCLGVEHFLRELGQFYEAEWYMVKALKMDINQRQLTNLPGVAADLLLDGFPLELMDGDASNIPLQWISDVLFDLEKKTEKRCRMRVITVLGVQSTGKSTLLNTMFGLQFPVASGRCTRGAFMTLIKVKENFQEELGCDFILVIDTEGLKAPELASLEHSYEHDNELATLVVGLSDIIIINMSMENITEMKDTLQIVVHAFLRMKEIGKKPNCQFVHQNVSDVSAHENNMRDRKKLLEQLNEMTKAAARLEKKSGITTFSDVMEYDLEEHSWYIPGLWHGVPPMAAINYGYSETILSLKKYLIELMKNKLKSQSPQNICEFLEWVKSLWNAIKHEKSIFSFRNSLVAEAYNQLSVRYSELEWDFRKQMHNWIIETENIIKNKSVEELQIELVNTLKTSVAQSLQKEESKMLELLEAYFESGSENVHLIERYREDFCKSVKSLRNELQEYLRAKIGEIVQIQRGKKNIQIIKDNCVKTIEDKVSQLLDNCRSRQCKLNDLELELEFETMWHNTLAGYQISSFTKQNVDQSMLQQLRKEMSNKGSSINERLLKIKSLSEFSQKPFTMQDEYIDLEWYKKCVDKVWYQAAGVKDFYRQEYNFKTNDLAASLLERCSTYITEKVSTKEDYHETFCQELLNMVNERIRQKDVYNLQTTVLFELDLKILILGRAALMLQKMHDDFVQKNDPMICLAILKSEYFSTFKNIIHKTDECRNRAQRFCELCHKPALAEYVNNHLGKEIVNDILSSVDSIKYKSRTFFQFTVLKKLIEDNRFDQYVEYINKYEIFVKQWILTYIKDRYRTSEELEKLQSCILSSIVMKIRVSLQDSAILKSNSVLDFLTNVCDKLKKELVISQNDIKVIIFKNKASIHQFAADIESFLTETGKDIISEMQSLTIENVLAKLKLKPEDELFKKVFGCGKQCPFCKVPCEAGAADHKTHFASVHRPQGLGRYRFVDTNVLVCSLCSTDVISNKSFKNSDTEWKFHPYKDYAAYYPDWSIQPNASISASDYWKFIFKQFNKEFAERYKAKPADLPDDWYTLTEEQALQSLKETFHMK
ncbi:up-regulator of cell proliferation-like [Discoglossus pictus]